MSSGLALASRVLRTLSTPEDYTPWDAPEASQPVTDSSLQHVAESLARGISDVQYQIESHVSTHFNVIKEQVDAAAAIQVEARQIAEDIAAITDRVENSTDGLEARMHSALREYDELQLKADVVEQSLNIVESLVQIDDLLSTYAEHVNLNDYAAAFEHAARTKASMDTLPPWEVTAVFEVLKDRQSSIDENLKGRLEYIVSQALCIDLRKGSVMIKVEEYVTAPGLGPDPISLQSALLAVAGQGLEKTYLMPFVRLLYKKVLEPVVRDARWDVRVDAETRSLSISLEENAPSSWSALPQSLIFGRLASIFAFFESSMPKNADGTSQHALLLGLLGTTFWTQLSSAIVECYLEKGLPEEARLLADFESVAEDCLTFEQDLVNKGLKVTGLTPLGIFCNDLEKHFTNKRHLTLLETARLFLITKDYATVQLEESIPVPLSNFIPSIILEPKREINAPPFFEKTPFGFPRCVISVTTQNITDLVRRTTVEARELSPYCRDRLQRSAHAILDLFRAVVPVHAAHRLATIPQMPMVLFNDCMYIAHHLLLLHLENRRTGSQGNAGYLGLAIAFRAISEQVLDAELARQRDILQGIIDDADGFDVLNEQRRVIVEKTLKQLTHQLVRLSNVWQPVTPPSMYAATLAPLISYTLRLLSSQVLALIDIGEQESHSLHVLLTSFHEALTPLLAGLSSEDYGGPPVPELAKFRHLVSILESSFAGIMELYRSAALKAFEEEELVRLVRALFADTPLRRANLEKIRSGAKTFLAVST
ncbi:Centromere/kinetochore protein zw10 [Thoreauomyces humboldtii]|nr:Centromere/kinetochore protein zw10 [Thoreauomyces humboldtii]